MLGGSISKTRLRQLFHIKYMSGKHKLALVPWMLLQVLGMLGVLVLHNLKLINSTINIFYFTHWKKIQTVFFGNLFD